MSPSLLRIEAIKVRRRSAFTLAVFIFTGFFVVMLAGMAYAVAQEKMHVRLPGSWNEMHEMIAQTAVFFSWITVVNLIAPEYAWRTSRQNVIDGLSRDQWFTAKLILVPLISLLFWAIAMVLVVPVMSVLAESKQPFMSAGQAMSFAMLLLTAIGFSTFGLFASFLTRHTAGAIAAVFGWMTLGEGLVQLVLFRMGEQYLKYASYLPVKAVAEISDPSRWAPETVRRVATSSIPTGTLLPVVLLYIVAFTAASWALVRRQDL
jgi:ABC-2 type transport system permease protein